MDGERGRFGLLLATLAATLVLFPFLGALPYLRGLLVAGLLVASVWAAVRERGALITLIPLALCTAGAYWAGRWLPWDGLPVITAAGALLFLWGSAVFVVRAVLSHRPVGPDTIMGALCGYLLIGAGWSFWYMLLVIANPDAIGPLVETSGSYPEGFYPPGYFGGGFVGLLDALLYFSFTTLTTLGYGDIVPRGGPARTFAYLEAVTGQIYLVVLVAWLVGRFANKDGRKG